MLIYIFAEHYPNPYKPQFDTEFAFFLRNGHSIKIFVGGQYIRTLHPRVRYYNLNRKTFLVPTTLKRIPKFVPLLITKMFRAPLRSLKRNRAIYDNTRSFKVNLIRFCRGLLLPEESPDLCYIHNLVTADLFDFIKSIYPSSKVVMYFHGGEVGGVKRVLRDAQLFGLMDLIFTNTNFSKKQAIERGSSPRRTIVLPVGHVLSDYPSSEMKRYREGGILRLISIGRLSEEKGLVYVLEAIAALFGQGYRELQYTIVGRGNQEKNLKYIINHYRLEGYINLVGELDKTGVVAQLENSDVLILPSIYTETWAETQANVVQEAMFMRLLVITTIAGGVPESIPDIMKQFSVPVCDSIAISKMIIKILSLSKSEMGRLGDVGRSFAVQRYDIDKIGFKFIEYAKKLNHHLNPVS